MTTINKIAIVRVQFEPKFIVDTNLLKKQYASTCSDVFHTKSNEKLIDILNFKINRNNENTIITAETESSWKDIESQLNEYKYIYFDFLPPNRSIIPPTLDLRVCILISKYIQKRDIKNLSIAVQNKEFAADYYQLTQLFSCSLEQGSIGLYQDNKLIIESKGAFNSYNLNKKPDEIEVTLTKLKQKLIRKIGYYPRINKDDWKIDKEFYDGSLCQPEISALLTNYIKQELSNNKKIVIIYCCSVSEWLKFPVRSVADEINAEVFPFEIAKTYSSKIDNADKVFIIYPLIQSLKTLKTNLDSLSINYSKNKEKFRVKAILYAGKINPIKESSNLTKARVGGEEVEFDYFLKVKKEYYEENSWEKELLQDEIKGTPDFIFKARTNHAELSSMDYWSLVKSAGLIPEKNVPTEERKGLNNIPDLNKMFSSYGAWLCQKVIERLKFSLDDDGFEFKNYLIITPDEHNVNIITDYLKDLYKFDIIRINRKYICRKEDIEKNEQLCEKIQYYDPKVIILDDFTRSGSTLTNLKKLMENLEKTIVKSLVLFEYTSETLESEKDYLSLYQITIPDNIGI